MNLIYPSDLAQGATYNDFLDILQRLWNDGQQTPASIEIHSANEWQLLGWIFPAEEDMLKKAKLHFKALLNPLTGTEMPLLQDGQMGIMRFLDAAGLPLAQLELYSLAQKALAGRQK